MISLFWSFAIIFYSPPPQIYQKYQRTKSEASGPIVVHGCAGVGRPGTFILIDTEIERFDNERCIHPFAGMVFLILGDVCF